MRPDFNVVDYHAARLFQMSSSADEFATTFKAYLVQNGWTEEEYFFQLNKDPNHRRH